PIIATHLNTGLTFCATRFAHSALDAGTPQIRNAFLQASQNAIRMQEELGKHIEDRGRYRPQPARRQYTQQNQPQQHARTATAPVGVRSLPAPAPSLPARGGSLAG